MKNDLLLPRILITNDDGIDAPGLAVLKEIVTPLTKELWIVAPQKEQSCASQKITVNQPIHVEQKSLHEFAVEGTPNDCIAIALNHLMLKKAPTLVISGINPSSNIGDEISLSGTVGAALTALMQGIPSIAISQCSQSDKEAPWDTTRAILPLVLMRLLKEGWRKETCPSINIPNLPPEKITGYSWARQGRNNIDSFLVEKRVNLRGNEYFWLNVHHQDGENQKNDEVSIMKRGKVSLVALSLDRSVDMDKPSISFNEPSSSEEVLENEESINI